MASKVGLVLALDGEKEFASGLKAAKGAVTETKAALEQINKQYSNSENSMEALTAKSEKYASIQKNLSTQLDVAKAGLAKSNENYDRINKTLEEYSSKVATARANLEAMEKAGLKGTDAYEQEEEALKQLTATFAQQNTERNKQIASILNWETQVRKTETAITSNNRAIEKNNQYMEEAKVSADGCATSIDKFGNTLKKVQEAEANPNLAKLKSDYESYREQMDQVARTYQTHLSTLSQINARYADAKSALAQSKAVFDGQANSVQALTDKSTTLATIQAALKAKFSELSAAIDQTQSAIDTTDAKLQEYATQIQATEAAMQQMEAENKQGTEEYRAMAEVLAELKAEEAAEFAAKNSYITAQAKLKTELADTKTKIAENNTEMQKNAQYLAEARASADGCATSIDKFGKAVKEAKENSELKSIKDDYASYKEEIGNVAQKAQDYNAAMAAVNAKNTEAKGLVNQAKAAFEGKANSIQALQEKENALLSVEAALTEKQSLLSDAIKNAQEGISQTASKLSEYKESISQVQAKLDALKASNKEGTEEYQKQAEVLKELKTQEAAVAKEHAGFVAEEGRLKNELAKTNNELADNGNEIKKTQGYMKEAGESADGCATSIDKFGREVKKTKEDVKSFGQMLEEKLMSQFGKEALFNMAVQGLQRIGRAAVQCAKDMVKVGMEFQAQMSRVAAISGSSGQEMQALTETAKELGRTTVYTAAEAGNAMEQLSLAGWKADDIIAGVPGVLDLASASGMDLAKAAEYVSDNLNAFGKPASDASRLADIMAYAMSNASMTTEDLGEAYEKVAATAAAYGYAETEVTAVLMNMANAGRKGGEAGTSLNTIMTRLATNTSYCADAVAEYNGGVDIMYDSAGKMRPLSDVLTDLYEVWKDLEPAQRNALAKTIAGTRQSNALFNVMAGMEAQVGSTARSFSDYADELEHCEGAAKKMADVSLDNLAGDVELMHDAVSGLYIDMEENADGLLRTLTQSWTDIVTAWDNAIKMPKSDLEGLIKDVESANKDIKGLVDDYNTQFSSVEANDTIFDSYAEQLIKLNEEAQHSESAQRELAIVVDRLSGSVPGLSDAFDRQTGTLKLENAEIVALIGNAKQLAQATAIAKAYQDLTDAEIEAHTNAAQATALHSLAVDDLNKFMEEHEGVEKKSIQAAVSGAAVRDEDVKTYDALALAAMKASQAEEEALEIENDVTSKADIRRQALADLEEQYGLTGEAAQTSAEVEGQAAEEVEQAANTIGKALLEMTPDEFANSEYNYFGLSAEKVSEISENAEQIASAYSSMSSSVESSIKGCINMMNEWSQGDAVNADDILHNLQSQIDGIEAWQSDLQTLANKIGSGMTQELYDQLVEMGPQAANLISEMAAQAEAQGEAETGTFTDIVNKWTEAMALAENADTQAIELATSQGQAVMEAYSTGLDLGLEGWDADQIVTIMETAAGQAKAAATTGGQETGTEYVTATGNAITANQGQVSTAEQGAIDNANSSTDTSGSYSVGSNISSGIASGISANSGAIAEAARSAVAEALAAAKAEAEIKSPSRKFKREVGKNIALGVAFGIKDNAHYASEEASKMSNKVLKEAKKWIKDYKKNHKISLSDEQYYWQQILLHVNTGTKAYSTAMDKLKAVQKKMQTASFKQMGFSDSESKAMEKKIKNLFDVDKYTGTGKNKKKKDAEKYYSDVLSAAKKYVSNKEILNDWSLEQELNYWIKVKKTLKKGTQAWYDATKEVKDLKAEIAQAAADAESEALARTRSNQDKILDYYKTYKKVSLQAEMQYWAMARNQLKIGTDERIEADQKYLEAREAYYDALNELDENYKNDYEEIVSDLESTVKDLQETYDEAVKSRKEEILSSMDLFEFFDTEGYTGDVLIENLQSQVEALGLWEEKLQELKSRGISDGLYEYLLGAGVDGAANVYAIADMTEEQLRRYEELFAARDQLASMQATDDNKSLLSQTRAEIDQATKDANDALKKLQKQYEKDLKEITADISTQLETMLGKAPQIAEEAVSTMFKSLTKAASVNKSELVVVTGTINGELSKLKIDAQEIGTESIAGLMQGLRNEGIITSEAKATVDQIKKALQEAAEIHSPSKLMNKEVGQFLGEGIAEGLDESADKTVASAEEMIRKSLNAARQEFERQEQHIQSDVSGMKLSSNVMLNDLVGQYSPQTVVNVDNSALNSDVLQVLGAINGMMDTIKTLQVVLDSGETVGALSPKMDKALASDYRSRNRGSKR